MTTAHTEYMISYQLGGRGSRHRKLSAAKRARDRAARAAARGGDCQSIGIVAIDYPADGSDPWGIERPLGESEWGAIQA